MKFRFFTAMALALISVVSTARADIQWETDYVSASARSRLSGKPMMIDFYTDWCGWCKKLDADVFPNPEVQAMAPNFIMVRLDAEKGGKDAAQQLQVKGYPNIVYMSSNGKRLYGHAGYREASRFSQTMKEVLALDAGEKGVAVPVAGAAAPRTGQNVMAQQQAVLRKLNIISSKDKASLTRTFKTTSTSALPTTYLDHKVKATSMGDGVLLLDESMAVAPQTPKKTVRVAAKPAKKNRKAKRVRN
ncbi:thioredoxin family protein [bacterium]|nr:MAG: thioredoxin family protein [bacterium]